jgi:hypothetical protein
MNHICILFETASDELILSLTLETVSFGIGFCSSVEVMEKKNKIIMGMCLIGRLRARKERGVAQVGLNLKG